MSAPNSQKAKQLANDLAAMDTYKDHSEYCWSHSSEIIAALRAQQDGPSERVRLQYEWLAPKLSTEERKSLDVIYAAASSATEGVTK